MAAEPRPRLVLASASPARRQVLIRAGLDPEILVPELDEESFDAPDVPTLVAVLAEAKAAAAIAMPQLGYGDVLVLACDSLLEMDGVGLGKPGSAEESIQRWRAMRGRTGRLHTGHHVIARVDGHARSVAAVATTEVTFAEVQDSEILAYAATGEPNQVAGAFTIDGLGAAYVETIVGDPHNVVGISVPLLRRMLAEVGLTWHHLWVR